MASENYAVERRIVFTDGRSPWVKVGQFNSGGVALAWIDENAKALSKAERGAEYRVVLSDGRIFSAREGKETQLVGLVNDPDFQVEGAEPEVTIPKRQYDIAKRAILIVDRMTEELDSLRVERDEAAVRLSEELAKGDEETSWYWVSVWSKLVEDQSNKIWELEQWLKEGEEENGAHTG
jgi:hypothetical protein